MKKVTLETSYIKTAITLADLARPIAQKYFRTKTDFLNKLDNSPVTIADREIETAMRSQIQREFPDHGILGEEFESYNLDSDYVWVLDPIDGTKSFITGKPPGLAKACAGTTLGKEYQRSGLASLFSEISIVERLKDAAAIAFAREVSNVKKPALSPREK